MLSRTCLPIVVVVAVGLLWCVGCAEDDCGCRPVGSSLDADATDIWRDLGYENLWTEPHDITEGCPFEIRWRVCYQANQCDDSQPRSESGPFTEILMIRDGSEEIREEFERDSIAGGECVEFVYEHPGVATAEVVEIEIEWFDDSGAATQYIDCVSVNADEDDDVPDDVEANNRAALQKPVGCHCGEHEAFDVNIMYGLAYDATDDELDWTVGLAWTQCADHGVDSRTITEQILITRNRDGATIHAETRSFVLTMNARAERAVGLPGLESGEAYSAAVEVSGADCSCLDVDLTTNNRATLEFTP